jgi:hypothetical protein
MKLNPEDLAVTSFQTSESDALAGPGGTYNPTAMTFCYYCPPQTFNNCPIGTAPEPVVIGTV